MKQQLLPLTSMRFIAAFFVLLSHLGFVKDDLRWSFLNIEQGFVGVTFFFILSGFILAYSYQERLEKKQTSRMKFFIARLARIYPLHFLTLMMAMPLVVMGGFRPIVETIPNLFLLHAWIPFKEVYFSANSPSWSISTEFFFYLMFPLLVFTKTHRLLLVFLVFISIQFIFLMFDLGEKMEHALFYISPIMRISDFILGILVYRFFVLAPPFFNKYKDGFQFISLFLFCLFIWMSSVYSIGIEYKYSIFYIIPLALIVFTFAFTGGVVGNILSNKYLVIMGEASFSLYLIHGLIIRYLDRINSRFEWFSAGELLIIVILLCLISSLLLFKYFEMPARKFVTKYFAKMYENTSGLRGK